MYRKIIILLSVIVSLLLIVVLSYNLFLYAGSRAYDFNGFRITDKSETVVHRKEVKDSSIRIKAHLLSTLSNKNAFLTNRAKLAKQDSIYLSFQIADSTLSLEMKGVALFTAKISQIKMSGIFKDIPDSVLNEWLSSPFTIKSSLSSIPKEDIVFRKAPKDTLEYMATATTPEAISFDPTYYRLSFDRGLDLYVLQQEEAPKAKRLFFRQLNLANLKTAADSILSGALPPFTPWIKIELKQEDALTIYRSLPNFGQMALSFK
ncbi:MAG: hypothetical protein PHS48_10895 [Bacteroidales bacterium]|nr:hypothetical protein [Bacteroidales bacterium]